MTLTLTTNSNSLSLPVTLSSGKSIEMMVDRNEIYFDSDGYVWLFSTRFNDGTVGNFVLQKRNTKKNDILELFKEYIVPLGLQIVGGKIREKHQSNPNLPAINLALWIAENYGPNVVGQIVDDINDYFNPSTWGYYEITTGEYVITHPMRVVT